MGDYVHCTFRVVNAIGKRLLADLQVMRLAAPLKEILGRLTLQSQGLPLNERLPSKYIKKAGSVDLTEATIFVQSLELHARIVLCARQADKMLSLGEGRQLNYGAATELLLRTLHGLHNLWRKMDNFAQHDCWAYKELTVRFGKLWKAFGWKVTTWVHWTVRHSAAYANLHKNFYKFSSIPTERRNVEFKMDVTHCYKGWKISRPYACKFGFAHVLNLSALDNCILLQGVRRRPSGRGRKRPVDGE